jgi:GH25 family lysozyme M1 (1,4-beta-N-acetylmuramidase)
VTLFGWDSSDYDWARGAMNLDAARRDGITWFTHKATEGTGTRHKHLAEALNRARSAGIEFVGAYHVVRTGDIAGQVAYMLAYLDLAVPWWREFPGFFLQVDLEKWPYDQVSAATGKAFAAALVKAQPRKVLTYASRGMYGDQLAGIVTPLWNAAYGGNPAIHYPDAYPGDNGTGWRAYSGQTPVMWQYGSQTRIGTQPTCDANAFRGSLADLRALLGVPQQGGDVMAVIVQWPPSVKGSLCFSNGSEMRHIPGTFELDQIKRGWPGIQTVDATKWPADVVHKLYGPEGPPWGTVPEPPTSPDEVAMVAIATRVARDTVAHSTLTPPD